MSFKSIIILSFCVIFSAPAWGIVFVEWSDAVLPAPNSLGVNQIVVAWEGGSATELLMTAHKQGYRVYVETPPKQAASAAKACAKTHCAGIFLSVSESESADAAKSIANLHSAYPKLPVRVLS